MRQLSLNAEWTRLERLSDIGDPLEKIAKVVDWELFRPVLEQAFYNEPKGPGGRPPIDRVLMFKIVMLQKWYQISDDQCEYQINDRLSFHRFLDLTLSDRVPDAKTLWLFKERLEKSGADRELFLLFAKQMEVQGIITRTGSIVDASFVEAPRQRNSRSENEQIKAGEVPESWSQPKLAQKDVDAAWAKKNNEVHFGYKNHIKVDAESKMIVDCTITPANTHDSQLLDELLDNQDQILNADSAYAGDDFIEAIQSRFPNLRIRVNKKGQKNRPLTSCQQAENRVKSKVRARVEHVFGHMAQSMHGLYVRTIGYARAFREITMKNLAYNLQRFAYIQQAKTS